MKTIPVRHITTTQRERSNARASRFSIRDVQQLLNGGDLVHDLHKHDFFFILALQKGNGLHEIDFMQYPVHDHSVFILRPGQVHRLQLAAGSTGFLVEFDLSFYRLGKTITGQRWRKATGKNYCEVEAARFTKLYSLLAGIFNEFTAKQEGYAEAIKAGLDLFFIEYIRQSRNPENTGKTESSYTQERFEELVFLLEENICRIKSVSQYAGLLNLSSYQLNAITKASAGKTVSDLINEQIILEAKRFLLATASQVKDVAGHLGYEDVSYFIRFFKRHTGHSPEAFRKNFK